MNRRSSMAIRGSLYISKVTRTLVMTNDERLTANDQTPWHTSS